MPSKDRLAELQTSQGRRKSQGRSSGDAEVRISLLPEPSRQAPIDKFLKKVESVTEQIDLLEAKANVVRSLHQNILNSLTTNSEDKQDLDRLMTEITVISTEARKGMQSVQKDVEEAERKAKNPLDFRIRKTHHVALGRKMMNIMTDYNREQIDFRQRCKNRIKRQLIIADNSGAEKTDEQLEELLKIPDPMIFSQDIIAKSKEAKEALADIEVRHQEILALEKNIAELKGLFEELAMLIESQSGTVDRIESNIEMAVLTSKDAKKQTENAAIKQKSARKLKIICAIVLVFVLIVVAVSLATYFR